MLVELPKENEVKCFLCRDEESIYRFGPYGWGIGENCIKALKTLVKDE